MSIVWLLSFQSNAHFVCGRDVLIEFFMEKRQKTRAIKFIWPGNISTSITRWIKIIRLCISLSRLLVVGALVKRLLMHEMLNYHIRRRRTFKPKNKLWSLGHLNMQHKMCGKGRRKKWMKKFALISGLIFHYHKRRIWFCWSFRDKYI